VVWLEAESIASRCAADLERYQLRKSLLPPSDKPVGSEVKAKTDKEEERLHARWQAAAERAAYAKRNYHAAAGIKHEEPAE